MATKMQYMRTSKLLDTKIVTCVAEKRVTFARSFPIHLNRIGQQVAFRVISAQSEICVEVMHHNKQYCGVVL